MKTNEIYMGDPFIYTHENTYYLIGTTNEMEGFRAYKSGDLENWTETGWILRKMTQALVHAAFGRLKFLFTRGNFI